MKEEPKFSKEAVIAARKLMREFKPSEDLQIFVPECMVEEFNEWVKKNIEDE